MRLGGLCSGVGGLELAVEQAFGCELAWCSEIDPAASRVLARRFEVPNPTTSSWTCSPAPARWRGRGGSGATNDRYRLLVEAPRDPRGRNPTRNYGREAQ